MDLWNASRYLNNPGITIMPKSETNPWFNANHYLGQRGSNDYKMVSHNQGDYQYWGGNNGNWN